MKAVPAATTTTTATSSRSSSGGGKKKEQPQISGSEILLSNPGFFLFRRVAQSDRGSLRDGTLVFRFLLEPGENGVRPAWKEAAKAEIGVWLRNQQQQDSDNNDACVTREKKKVHGKKEQSFDDCIILKVSY